MRYYDPLPKESTASRQQAVRVLAYFSALGWPQQLPPREEGLCQKDCVSCGIFCLHWAESLLREHRGEGPSLADFEPKKRLQTLKNWLGCLVSKAETARWHIAQQQGKAAKKAAKADKEAAKGAKAAPPPSQPASSSSQAAGSKASEAGSKAGSNKPGSN